MFLWLEESEYMHWFNLTLLNAYVHVRWVHLKWEPDYRNILLPACLCICVHTNLHPNSQSKYLTLAEPGTANFPLLSQRREEQRSGWCWREEAWSCHGKSSQVRSFFSSFFFFFFSHKQYSAVWMISSAVEQTKINKPGHDSLNLVLNYKRNYATGLY